MKTRTPLAILAATAIASLAAVGCSSDPDKSTTSSAVKGDEASALPSQPASATSVPVDATTDRAQVGQGSDNTADATLLAMLYSLLDVGTQQELVTSYSRNVPQDEVATCMKAAGFTYVEDASLEPEAMATSDLRYTMPADEYARQYGLGVTGWDLGLFPPNPTDPNQGYAASLSAAQRDAYQQSLRNCQGGQDPAARRAESAAFNVALATFRDAVASDDRVVSAAADWQACMSRAGFDYDGPLAMRESFYTRMSSTPGRSALEQLHNEEVTVAVANVPCEAAYTESYRNVIAGRFAEFKTLYESALASGAVPDGEG